MQANGISYSLRVHAHLLPVDLLRLCQTLLISSSVHASPECCQTTAWVWHDVRFCLFLTVYDVVCSSAAAVSQQGFSQEASSEVVLHWLATSWCQDADVYMASRTRGFGSCGFLQVRGSGRCARGSDQHQNAAALVLPYCYVSFHLSRGWFGKRL